MRYGCLLLALLTFSCSLIAQSPEQTIIAKEKAALDRWSQGDTYGYIELGADEITYFAEGSDTLIVGFEAFKAANEPLHGKFTIPRYEMIEPRVQLHGDVGVLTFVLNNYNDAGAITSRWKSTKSMQNSIRIGN
jgi:hypothetical protein